VVQDPLELTIVPHRADLPEALDDRLGDYKYFQQSGGTSADGVTVVFSVRSGLFTAR
jgi:hypothetical protein